MEQYELEGTVFDIQRFSIHDGYGIRSTVFLKGCMLRCLWCQNPEGISPILRLWHFPKLCIQCGTCISVCRDGALSAHPHKAHFISIDQQKCTKCDKCTTACPTDALAFDGKQMTVYEVMNTLLKDKIFYENSSGGVTISGGDPLLQHEFALAILASCKDHGIHTAIETCLAAEWEILERFIPVVDLFIVDLKLFDSMQHQHFTGYLNDGIKQNYKRLVSTGVDLLTRVPLIPGATATKENIESLAVFISKYNPGGKVELMNFNPLAQSKYNLMDQNNEFLKGKKPYKPEELQQFNAILEKYSLQLIKEHQS